MTILGPCRHRYGIDSRCDITVVETLYGPGHTSPPRTAHYPVTTPRSAPHPIGIPVPAAETRSEAPQRGRGLTR